MSRGLRQDLLHHGLRPRPIFEIARSQPQVVRHPAKWLAALIDDRGGDCCSLGERHVPFQPLAGMGDRRRVARFQDIRHGGAR